MTAIFAPTTGRTPTRARHCAPRTPFRQAVRDWFGGRRKRAAQVADAPAVEPIPVVPALTIGDALTQLAIDSRLLGYDSALIAVELRRLVPRLHPTEAADRFHGLQNACEGRVKVLAALEIPGADDLGEAVAVAKPYWDGLVDNRLDHMFAPSIAFNDDGTPWTPTDAGSSWTVQTVEPAVAA